MRKLLSIFLIGIMAVTSYAQISPKTFQSHSDVKVPALQMRFDGTQVGAQQVNPIVSSPDAILEDATMQTQYDLQTNAAQQNRLYRYADGTVGVTAMWSNEATFADRGTGYNYFNGSAWGPQPTSKIETVKTGWPSYAPLGANGEIVIAHQSGTLPMIISKRETKGTGAWTQSELPPPAGASGLLWGRMVTSGADRMTVHVMVMTSPAANGGVPYQGLDGALVYNRSLDGGTTWDGWELPDGMTSSEYLGFGGDSYAWAEPNANTLAFVVGDSWNDQFIMKSTDNGDNWEKIMIWDCPYDLWAGGDTTGDFYAPDGSSAAAIGPDGKIHVVFGLLENYGDEAGDKYYYPWRDGLIYWNTSMAELPEVLDPDELFANGNMIGWLQDTTVWSAAVEQLAYYYCSMSSIPSIVVDESNQVFAFWSSVTSLLDINNFLLRHVYARASDDGGTTWRDTIAYVTDDFLLQWSEIVYFKTAASTTDKIYFLYQEDGEAGTYLKGSQGAQGQVAITNNSMMFGSIDKVDILLWPVGVNEAKEAAFTVSQNTPNPVRDYTTIAVHLDKPGTLTLTVYNTMGQQVLELPKGMVNAGNHYFSVQADNLTAGVYFYTVTVDNQSVTKRMIVN